MRFKKNLDISVKMLNLRKSCYKTFRGTIKRPNQRIMGIYEEEIWVKDRKYFEQNHGKFY